MQVRAKLCRLHNEYKTICMQLTEAGKADGPPLGKTQIKLPRILFHPLALFQLPESQSSIDMMTGTRLWDRMCVSLNQHFDAVLS